MKNKYARWIVSFLLGVVSYVVLGIAITIIVWTMLANAGVHITVPSHHNIDMYVKITQIPEIIVFGIIWAFILKKMKWM